MQEYAIAKVRGLEAMFLPMIINEQEGEVAVYEALSAIPSNRACCLEVIRQDKEKWKAKFLENNGLEEFMGYEIPKNSCGLTRHILTLLSQRGVAVLTHDDRSTPRKQLEDIADANGFTTFKEENRIVLIDENHWG